jgi:hypothetical protein
MALTKEFVHGVTRPPSLDAAQLTEQEREHDEHIAHCVAAMICTHFELGDHYAAMRAHTDKYLDPLSDTELAEATELANGLIAELDQN